MLPHVPVYQFQTATVPVTPPITLRVVVPPEQIADKVDDIPLPLIAKLSFTVIAILLHCVVLQIPSDLT